MCGHNLAQSGAVRISLMLEQRATIAAAKSERCARMADIELFKIGGYSVTLFRVLVPVAILVAAFVAASTVATLFGRLRVKVGPNRASFVYLSGQIIRYLIIFVGVFAAASAIGLNLSSLSIFAGALGIGIGLGLQDIVKNFTCGIILLLDRSIEVGDFIELEDGTAGAVVSIGPRATTIRTNDNVDILLPNAQLLNGQLTNWTHDQTTRRVHIPFGVAYGTDKERVKQAALEAALAVPFTRPDDEAHKTQVWLVGFGDSALDFELVVWPTLEAIKRPGSMMAAYRWALDDALRTYNIELPFPQRDLRLRGFAGLEGDALLDLYARGSVGQGDRPSHEEGSRDRGIGGLPSENDAAADIPAEEPRADDKRE